jgi:hypothetical protein
MTWSLMSFVLGVTVTTVVAIAAPQLLHSIRRSLLRSGALSRFNPALFRYDFTSIGQFQLGSWSINHPLQSFELKISDPPAQTWCDERLLEAKRLEIHREGGPAWFLTDFEVDDKESAQSQIFRATFAPSTFRDFQAISHLLREDQDLASELLARASEQNGLRSLVRGSPKTAFGVQVNVVSRQETFLAFRRSMTVGEHQGLWMLGCGETMSESDLMESTHQSDQPSFIPFCQRALREEVGLEPSDYGEIRISWLGLNLLQGSNLLVAHVESNLSENQIERRISQCPGTHEMTELDWYSFRNGQIRDLIKEMELSDIASKKRTKLLPRHWVPGQLLVLKELLRVHPALLAERN